MEQRYTRREAICTGAAIALAGLGAAACGKPKHKGPSCNDTSNLPPEAVALRTSPSVQYEDVSLDPVRLCSRCQHFVPGAPDACGTCKVLKGPVSPRGSCKLFVQKPA